MHEMTTDHVHEEIQLLAIDFSTMFFETTRLDPRLARLLPGPRPDGPHYRYLQDGAAGAAATCAAASGGCSSRRSTSSSSRSSPTCSPTPPSSSPTATRSRSRCRWRRWSPTPPACTRGRSTPRPHRPLLGRPHRGDARARASATATCSPAERRSTSRFDDFMADDVAMVERIYDLAGQPMTDDRARAAMQSTSWPSHPRGRHGGMRYDLADFGLDRAERRAGPAASTPTASCPDRRRRGAAETSRSRSQRSP